MARWVTLAALKGGVSKTASSLALAQLAAHRFPRKRVIYLVLDSNSSAHERYVRQEDRVPLEPQDAQFEGPLWYAKPAKLAREKTLNHLLLSSSLSARTIDAGSVDAALYRRPDLPNLGVLMHVAGTLGLLSRTVETSADGAARLKRLLEHLDADADLVIVDTPADQEVSLVRTIIQLTDLLVPVTDSSRGGVDSVADILGLGITGDVPVVAVLQSPAAPYYDPDRDGPGSDAREKSAGVSHARREASADVAVLAERFGLQLVRVPQDSFLPNTEDQADVLPVAWAALSDAERRRPRVVGRGERSPRAVDVLASFAGELVEMDDGEIDRRWARVLAVHDRVVQAMGAQLEEVPA